MFASRPLSPLIRWYNKQGDQQNNLDKRVFSSMGLFMDWKLQTVTFLSWVFGVKVNFKFYDVTVWLTTAVINILLNISKSKGNR